MKVAVSEIYLPLTGYGQSDGKRIVAAILNLLESGNEKILNT